MRRLAAVTVVAAYGLVTSCSGGSGGSGGAEAGGGEAAAELSGTLREATLFETQRAFSLRIRPSGDRDLRIGSIQLGSPLFESVTPQRRDTLVRATDRAVEMPLRFGAARCDEEADGPAELITDIDGEEVRVALDESPSDLLVGRHASECAVADVLADVEVRFGDRWERTGPRVVETDVELVQRRPGVTATVEEMEGNVIFTVSTDGGSAPWLEVNDDQPSDAGRLVIDASRCDPHALIEYKRKFILPARVQVGDDEPVRVDVEAEGEGRQVLEELLTTCVG